jgi:hypothetical protein
MKKQIKEERGKRKEERGLCLFSFTFPLSSLDFPEVSL